MQHLKQRSKHGTVLAVSMMKDEAPYLLEWVAHHLAVGFTDLLVYTNDCSDGTVEMLQRLEALGLAHHRDNVIAKGRKPQPSAIRHAQAEPLVAAADWVMVFDADEFLSINHPGGTLEAVLDETVAQGANGLVVTWRIFGSGGVTDWSRTPVTEQYTRAAPPLWNKGWGVKTLFKFDPEHWKLGIHRPSIKNKWLDTNFPHGVHWLNGSGQPMEDYFKFRGWRSIRRTLGYDWAQMNHYAVKSIDAYAVRKFRGNVNNKADKYNADYWALQDRNEVEDRSIARHAAARAAIMEALLTDPILADLHGAALTRIEARLSDFKATPEFAALRDSLLAASRVPITQVEAKPPKPRDPAKIDALMSDVERRSATPRAKPSAETVPAGWATEDGDPFLPGPIDFSADLNVDWTENHGIALPADPRLFKPEALNAVITGRFERRHARNIAGYVPPGVTLLDWDSGTGFLAIRALKSIDGLRVYAAERRQDLRIVTQAVAERAGAMDYAGFARLSPVDGDKNAKIALTAAIAEAQPDVLRMARPGPTAGDMLAAQDLTAVTRILVPFPSDAAAADLRAQLAPVLSSAGFTEAAEAAANGSLQFDRRRP